MTRLVATMVHARIVKSIGYINKQKQKSLLTNEERSPPMNETALSKDLLIPRSITSKELAALVDEYVADGGKITQCPPGAALNFRSVMGDPDKAPKLKRPAPGRKNQAPKSPKNPKKGKPKKK